MRSSAMLSHLLIWFVLVLGPSCAPSAAQRAEARAQQERAISERRARLAENAERRRAAGDQPPAKPDDPGGRVGNCVRPTLPDEAVSVNTLQEEFVCANTGAGREVVRWREWYCQGEDRSCVLSSWKNGEPTFGPVLGDAFVQKVRGFKKIKVDPVQ